MRRITSLAIASLAMMTALSIGSAASAADNTTRSTPQLAYNKCPRGSFCIYSGYNGTSQPGKGMGPCHWSQSRLANTADNCRFIQLGTKVKSVWNRTNHRVQYYAQTNYHGRVGSTGPGIRGNLMGDYQIRSFQPQ